MQGPSEPKLNKSNPKKWFIYFHFDVPYQLWNRYKRKRIRFKKYDNINRYTGEEKEKQAQLRLQVWKYALFVLNYNPFEEQLKRLRHVDADIKEVEEEITEVKKEISEGNRHNTTITKALDLFIKSRLSRKLSKASISAYQGSVNWLLEGLKNNNKEHLKASQLKFTDISDALDFIAEDREWTATTINKEIDFINAIFNWLEEHEFITKNIIKKKFTKLPAQKSKHTWYDRALAKTVKQAVIDADKINVLRAMQFTYYLMIRSKKELQMLKIKDIDQELKRVRFSAELSKNKSESFRDYPEKFQDILDEMQLQNYPADYYVFGKLTGLPGPFPVSHNFFSKQFKAIKDKIGLSANYTIYGWKHTRIVHELMKGTSGEQISHMARHHDFKQTQDYLRDYDITLKNVYKLEDLDF